MTDCEKEDNSKLIRHRYCNQIRNKCGLVLFQCPICGKFNYEKQHITHWKHHLSGYINSEGYIRKIFSPESKLDYLFDQVEKIKDFLILD
jgi:uncharacterized C2H2 Zn-finger protein